MVKLLVIFVLLMYVVGEMGVYSLCCHSIKGRCADGTKGTPYCGYKRCNIFGCNCVHCRVNREKREVNGQEPPNGFKTMDKNQNGQVDKDEAHSHLLLGKFYNITGDFAKFEKYFAQFDKDGDGKLSYAEINAAG